MGELHQITAAVYLAAALASAIGLALPSRRATRIAQWGLGGGAALHAAAFYRFHELKPAPSLDTLPSAISIMAWMGVLFFLVLGRRGRLAGLGALVGVGAFLGVFWASILVPGVTSDAGGATALWSHAHVLLASGGLAAFGVAGLAGALFLAEHRRLKAKRVLSSRSFLPPLEALDRVNRVSLAVGFPLLSLGVLTGALWAHAADGRIWPGTPHASWSAVAWVIYAVLVGARFGAHQGARASAVNAVGGFLFLLFAVLGVGALT